MPVAWVVRRAAVGDAVALADLAAETFPLACPPGFDADAGGPTGHAKPWFQGPAVG